MIKHKWNGTVLTISGNGNMEDYGEWTNDYGVSYAYDAPWGTGITKIIINDGVTSIGDFAFSFCKNLSEVDLGDRITTMESRVFEGCKNLVLRCR